MGALLHGATQRRTVIYSAGAATYGLSENVKLSESIFFAGVPGRRNISTGRADASKKSL